MAKPAPGLPATAGPGHRSPSAGQLAGGWPQSPWAQRLAKQPGGPAAGPWIYAQAQPACRPADPTVAAGGAQAA